MPVGEWLMRFDRRSVDRGLLFLCAIVNIVPLYFTKHLPFSDLPEHVAAIATMRHYWDPAWDLQRYFVVQDLTRTQYLLYDVVAAVLAVPFGSAERANLLLLSLVGIGFPYSLRALLRATNRDERLAVFACALFWSRALGEGLLNYVASIPVLLYALALVAREAASPDRRRAGALSLLSLVLFYLHVSTFVVFVAGAALIMLFAPAPSSWSRLRRLPARLGWLGPVVLAGVLLLWSSPFVHPEPVREGSESGVVRFLSTPYLVHSLMPWMHDFWRSRVDDVAGYVLWILFGVLLFRAAPRDPKASPGERAAPFLAVLVLVTYFTVPDQLGFAFILDLRLAPIVGIMATLFLRPRDDKMTTFVVRAMAVAALVVGVHGAWQMDRYEREEAAAFDRVVKNLPRGKKLLTLIFERESHRANVTPFLHFGSYYAARYGGVSSFSFAEVPHWPIQYRAENAPPKKKYVFWDWNPCLFRNTVDGPYYDFILTRGEVDLFPPGVPGPVWRTIGGSREWTLYEKTDRTSSTDGAEPDHGPCRKGAPIAER